MRSDKINIESILLKLYNNVDCEGISITKELLSTNKEFESVIVSGIQNGAVRGLSEEEWDKMLRLHLRSSHSLQDAFVTGYNIGACTTMSKLVSYIFDNCKINGGTNKFLVGTKNSPNGEHTWILHDNLIYDTTFMLVIDQKYAQNLGYTLENSNNPNNDKYYRAAKEFATDPNIDSGIKR